ncbi:MAG: hypothetical protein HY870_04280 [Chloroflexi bacterium]|nr:hypothetical protein [Chloroflexota bacterium]
MRVFGGLAALVVMAVVVTGVILAVRQPTTSPVVNPSSSRVVSTTGYVDGWYTYGGDTKDYEVGLDAGIVHSGKASGYIKSKVSNPKDFGNLMQMMLPDLYAGKRLHLSAYLKTEQVEGRAGLWMRVDGPQGSMTSIDNMVNRPIRGTTDWQKYDVVLDVPADSANIAFGVLLNSSGQVWIDDVQFEVVGTDVATTAVTEEMMAAEVTPEPTPRPTLESTPSPADLTALAQPTNSSFETDTTGWTLMGDVQDYVSGVDSTVTFDGQGSGILAWDTSKPIGLAKLVQSIKAKPYRTQRARISAWVKSDQISERRAYFFATVDSTNSELPLSSSCLMSSVTWQKCELVLDVPDTATRIDYGISLDGQGRAWLDDVQVEIVGKDIQVTAYLGQPDLGQIRVQGIDLDGNMPDWGIYGGRPQAYEMGFDDTVAHTGQSSAYIKSTTSIAATDFGTLSTGVAAGYRGKRVRLSAYIKANNVKAWAGLWMRVDGPSGKIYSLDNMEDRSIQGNSDWQKYEVVLDVPDDSTFVAYGVLLSGEGEVWFDDVQLEVVGDDVPVTDLYHRQPLNLDFEISK